MNKSCPFCTLPSERVWLSSANFVGVLDQFPVAEGHALIIPKRHAASIFDLDASEQKEAWQLVAQVRSELMKKYNPAGFTIGVNDGRAAGQTIDHAHVHVIPRRIGDVQDPRGGVRWVIPSKADYWSKK